LPTALGAGIIAGMLDLILLVAAWATIATVLLGLVALYQAFGMAALWGAVGLLFVVHLALQRRGTGYFDPGGSFSGSGPLLPVPGKQALPVPGPRQIGKSQRPAPKK
jgi:hypothetical protein